MRRWEESGGSGYGKKKKVGGGQEIGPFKWERCFLKKKKKKERKFFFGGVHFQLVGGYSWKHA